MADEQIKIKLRTDVEMGVRGVEELGKASKAVNAVSALLQGNFQGALQQGATALKSFLRLGGTSAAALGLVGVAIVGVIGATIKYIRARRDAEIAEQKHISAIAQLNKKMHEMIASTRASETVLRAQKMEDIEKAYTRAGAAAKKFAENQNAAADGAREYQLSLIGLKESLGMVSRAEATRQKTAIVEEAANAKIMAMENDAREENDLAARQKADLEKVLAGIRTKQASISAAIEKTVATSQAQATPTTQKDVGVWSGMYHAIGASIASYIPGESTSDDARREQDISAVNFYTDQIGKLTKEMSELKKQEDKAAESIRKINDAQEDANAQRAQEVLMIKQRTAAEMLSMRAERAKDIYGALGKKGGLAMMDAAEKQRRKELDEVEYWTRRAEQKNATGGKMTRKEQLAWEARELLRDAEKGAQKTDRGIWENMMVSLQKIEKTITQSEGAA